mmetsp:Transcript_3126/g.6500  ORF Transcript_3126/g.6500 Transcript_3126/m.6500 type:complete len:246 (+) Transcript_3126:623-1360(+)
MNACSKSSCNFLLLLGSRIMSPIGCSTKFSSSAKKPALKYVKNVWNPALVGANSVNRRLQSFNKSARPLSFTSLQRSPKTLELNGAQIISRIVSVPTQPPSNERVEDPLKEVVLVGFSDGSDVKVGSSDGSSVCVGYSDGVSVGRAVGISVGGAVVGRGVGRGVGLGVGNAVGLGVGLGVGEREGSIVSILVGEGVGRMVGPGVGAGVGFGVGILVGLGTGGPVGLLVGRGEGLWVGRGVGRGDG